jgi:hypothetical protein
MIIRPDSSEKSSEILGVVAEYLMERKHLEDLVVRAG